MKRLIILSAVLLIAVQGIWAQNSLFVEFDFNFYQLQNHLQEVSAVHIVDAQDERELVAEQYGGKFIYSFNRGWLYQTALQKAFTNKKAGKTALEGCLAYFERTKAEVVEVITNTGKNKHIIYRQAGKIYELKFDIDDKKKASLSLTSKYVPNTPVGQWTSLDYAVIQDLQVESDPMNDARFFLAMNRSYKFK